MTDRKMNLLAYAITGKEFVAMDDLTRYGIDHWRGVRIEFERRGKQRTAEPHEYPAIHNYIWLRPEPAQMQHLSNVRFLGSTFHFISRAGVQQLERFADKVNAEYQKDQRAIGNRKAIADRAAFKAGDKLEIVDGPLAGEIARFAKLVQGAQDLFPTIKAEMELMGRVVPVTLDPLAVRKAANA